MNKELTQAWLNVLNIEPKETVRLTAKQAMEISLEYGKLLKLKLDVSKLLPTDDELDEAAVEYCKSVYSDRPEIDDYQDGVEAFDAGAIWMKEKLV